MKKFKAQYMFKNPDEYSRYISEFIEARGVMHAHKLAIAHAKEMKAHIDHLHEVIDEDEDKHNEEN